MADLAPSDDILAREAEILARVAGDPLLHPIDLPAAVVSQVSLGAVADLRALSALPADASVEAIERALVRLRESLPADLDRLSRESLRQIIRTRQPQIPARMVDAAVAAPPRSTTAATVDDAMPMQGTAVTLDDPAPWPVSVDGAALLDDTVAAIRRYVAMTAPQADALALWVGIAYAIDALAIAPILLLSSATMRSGKTTTCIVLGALTPRAVLISSVTAAVLYRLIEAHRPTLIGDEADTWLTDERSELRGVVNAGHTRATATVARCVGDAHEVRLYSVWCARVLAMIGRPPGTIRDRSITIELRRRTPDEPIARLRADRIDAELHPLRRQWRRWVDDHTGAIREADPDVPAGLHDRAADCWRPLLTLADLASGDWPDRARVAARELCGAVDDEDIAVELLRDIRSIYVDGDRERMSSTDLAAALVALPDRPWRDWSRGRPLSPARLARLLTPYGAVPIQYRDGTERVRGYTRRMLTDAWTRYLGGSSRDSVTDPVSTESDPADSKCDRAPSVTPSKSAIGPIDIGVDHTVTARSGGSSPRRECARVDHGDPDGAGY